MDKYKPTLVLPLSNHVRQRIRYMPEKVMQ